MPHLPNEIWLLIASYCEPKDLWLGLRSVNRQLHECTEEYFEFGVLPHIALHLPVKVPTYDMRTQVRGKAIFKNVTESNPGQHSDRVLYELSTAEPALYRTHILGCWNRMCNSADRSLSEDRNWEMQLGRHADTARLRKPILSPASLKYVGSGHDRISFEWKPAVTSFFR